MKIQLNTDHFLQCIKTLESSLERLQQAKKNSIDYEVFRNAVVKSFELTLETAGKLLRKKIKNYLATPREADELTYKDLFRQAVRYGLLTTEETTRWFLYRDNRNDTAHDYGVHFAEKTLQLLSQFLNDAKNLEKVLKK